MTSDLLEAKALDEQPHKLSPEILSREHHDVLLRAIHNVLCTPSAEVAYAQIIDGAPLREVYDDVSGWVYPFQHPMRTEHLRLCPGVLERTKQIRELFDLNELRFETKLLHDYHAAAPGSRVFKTRLIEIVAISIHQIAVILYNLGLNLGNHQDWAAWTAPTSDRVTYSRHPDGKLTSLFYQDQYRDHNQYPQGAADMVGYWAESQIFGGVVLFDRRRPDEREPHEDPDAVFFHSDRKEVTYRIWQLLDTQKKQLLDFLLGEPDSVPSPFPILADSKNLTRIDPEEPILETGIYRDLWERKPLGNDDGDRRSHCCAYNSLDYPSRADYRRARERCSDRKMAIEERKDEESEAMDREIEAQVRPREAAGEDDEVARILKKD